jgi:hypothetical protein
METVPSGHSSLSGISLARAGDHVTAWSRALLEKLIVRQLSKKLPIFYGI